MMRLAIALLLALSADALVLSPTRALALSPARALRINMCAEGPTGGVEFDEPRHDQGRLQGDELVDRGLRHLKPKLKAAFATADPGTGWIGPTSSSLWPLAAGR